jgi:hypothetical protein
MIESLTSPGKAVILTLDFDEDAFEKEQGDIEEKEYVSLSSVIIPKDIGISLPHIQWKDDPHTPLTKMEESSMGIPTIRYKV